MDDSTNPRARVIAALAEMFFEKTHLADDFAHLEFNVIEIGHECMAEAFGLALEALDAYLLSNKPESLHVHDIRSRTLATEIGDVTFSIRRYRDRFGSDVYLLSDTLDIAYGTRLSWCDRFSRRGRSSYLVCKSSKAYVSSWLSSQSANRDGVHASSRQALC